MLGYRIRRALTWPRRVVLRRKHGRLPMLEATGHRRSMYRFVGAVAANPDLLHEADLDASSVVVDAGAFVGEWSEPVARRYGCRIEAYEPVPGAAKRAAKRLDGLGVTVHPFGLGGRDETVSMALAGPGSAAGGKDAGFGSRPVELRDAAAVLDELGVEEVDLLKLNIEGGEYDVLDRLSETGWLPRIRQVTVQFHEWHPGAYRRRRAIRRRLRETHEEVWCYPWVWEFWRRR